MNRYDPSGSVALVDDIIVAAVITVCILLAATAIYSASPAGQAALEGLIKTAEDINKAARTAVIEFAESITIDKKATRDNNVYIMRDQEKRVAYVGRTNDPERRQAEHSRDPSKADLQPLEVVATGLTKDEARAFEQLLISAYLLENLYNARREIAANNLDNYRSSLNQVVRLLGSLSEEELYHLMGE